MVFRYEDRIISVHPSLLPSFPGAETYLQALEEEVRIAGVTAHYVTTDLDQGPIIAQRAFNVPPDAAVEDLQRIGQRLEARRCWRLSTCTATTRLRSTAGARSCASPRTPTPNWAPPRAKRHHS